MPVPSMEPVGTIPEVPREPVGVGTTDCGPEVVVARLGFPRRAVSPTVKPDPVLSED